MPRDDTFTDRELATLLAALRLWQASQDYGEDLAPYIGHFEEHQPLSSLEIDELCERLNCA
jgi:hypothetical protein